MTPTGPGVELDPPYDWPAYRSSELRCPKRPLLKLPEGPTERHGPVFGTSGVVSSDADLTTQHRGEPLGERDHRERPAAR